MPGTWRFDGFEVDPATHQLSKRGLRIRLREQCFQMLALLLERAGQVVTREELRKKLWASDTFVDFENGLNTAVGRLREKLGDCADRPRYIETLPRVGYRFIAHVTEGPPQDVPAAPRPKARLLVLPFVNVTGDASLDYFSDAVTDEIITELSTLAPAEIGVIARTTAMRYKGTPKDVAHIARELTLDWVVEGAVRRTTDRVSLTVQLIRAGDQTHALARRYDVPLGDIFDTERSVALAIGEQIGVPSSGVQDSSRSGALRPVKKPTEDLIAYNCYIQGRQHLERGNTPEAWTQARLCLEAALARDARFALAHDALADLWWHVGFWGLAPPRETLEIGIVHAVKAVELDGSLADAHSILAQYRKQYEFDWDEVAREMAIALKLNPASPNVRRRHAITGLMPLGRLDEAIRELHVALDLDPLNLFSRSWLGVMLWLDRQYDRALDELRLQHEIGPTHFLPTFVRGLVCLDAGRCEEGVEAFRGALELTRGAPLILGWLGAALASTGDVAGARAIRERLRELSERMYVAPTGFAWIHFKLGEIEEFFEWMNRSIDARDHIITPIKTYPFLDPIRGDPRYLDLLRRMKLA